MDSIWPFAFAVLFTFTFCEAKLENCSEVRCKLLPVEKSFTSEFLLKVSEKGVRLVYVNLKIGNESYNPLDVSDKFLSNNWVWANTIREPMLSLSYDYDILSLGLLTYQVRRMDVKLTDQPTGCLANLNSSCQDKVVARALLNLTEHDSSERLHGRDIVCNAVIRRNVVVYRCCGKNKQGSAQESSVKCELVVERSSWFQAFNNILIILTVIMVLYCPAFLLALPDCIFNFRYECEQDKKIGQRQDQVCVNEGDEDNQGTSEVSRESDRKSIPGEIESVNYNLVYLDDASPITCSTFFSRCTKDFTDLIPFNFKLAFLCYCLIPIFEYISVGLNYTLKREFFEEALRKRQPSLVGYWLPHFLSVPYTILFGVSPLVMILFATPNDFLPTGWCLVCREETSSIGEDIFTHIKELQQNSYNFASWLIKKHKAGNRIIYCTHLCLQIITPPCKRLKRALIVLLVLIYNAILITICWGILGVVYFCIFLVGFLVLGVYYSPLTSLIAVVIRKSFQFESFLGVSIGQLRERSSLLGSRFFNIPFMIAILIGTSFFTFFLGSLLYFVSSTGALAGRFIANMFGYVIMGLVLNADIASPFVAFFVVASTNMYLCYYNLQKKYQEVKEMISQQWQKHKHLLENSTLSNNEEVTIPEDLFWYICDEKSISHYKVLPVSSEVFRMLFNMALILTFLLLTLSSIIFLERAYSISAVVSTIAVFLSGVIPGLFFKGLTKENRFSVAIKSEMMKKIEIAVKEFIVIVSI